ncbi:MAG: glycogen debranching protein GlgX [Deltaproteobacteria bacterium]|nr:glycogen debranching protein GlgX [Deltaproteobacteria bacterium]
MTGVVLPGRHQPLGATWDGRGVNFAVWSSHASAIDLCLFDPESLRETMRIRLPETTAHVFHGYVPGLGPGALYGYRAHGPWDPERGHRFNAAKLLVDPYARALAGRVDHRHHVLGHVASNDLLRDLHDSAGGCPKGVVVDDRFDWEGDRAPDVPWTDTVLYEVHLKGMTARHPDVAPGLRGSYAGFASEPVIAHLKKLGVTSVELLPIHQAIDDAFLFEKGLTNYWGYQTLGYFAPDNRFSSSGDRGGQVREFKKMVKRLHAAGIEVILDVVFNHTCEGNHLGPTLCFRGLDNAAYYWLGDQRRLYADFTGTGNSLDPRHPQVLKLVMDSLRYWVTEMHVDGFRFDLATTLGRTSRGFSPHAPFFDIVHQDPVLARAKLIAEPWDVGEGGYQVGGFPQPFAEWNGKYRDNVRRFWAGYEPHRRELGFRVTGSSDLFQASGRRPYASINFVTAHDGFPMADLVSYERKHNEANGEGNRDGDPNNNAWNCGVEGPTSDPEIVVIRRKQVRNMLSTLLLSQGVPMLLGGDEIGRTQRGNNNAYCQDNEVSWFDWDLDDERRALLEFTAKLVSLRREHPVLRRRRFFQGVHVRGSEFKDLAWFRPDGEEMTRHDWDSAGRAIAFLLGGDAILGLDDQGRPIEGDSLLVLINGERAERTFRLPAVEWGADWEWLVDTAHDSTRAADRPSHARDEVLLEALSIVVLRCRHGG